MMLQLHIICCSITKLVWLVDILQLNFRRVWLTALFLATSWELPSRSPIWYYSRPSMLNYRVSRNLQCLWLQNALCYEGMHLDNDPDQEITNRFSRDTSLRPNLPGEKKWNIGMQIPANPRDIMTRVLEVLRDLNVNWKKIGLYNIKCRWVYSTPQSEPITAHQFYENHYMNSAIVPNNIQSQSVVKFEIQLYKTPEDSYLVDIQKINGPQLIFLDFCAALIFQLETGIF